MENLTKRVPLINKLILKNIDEKSRINFKQSSRGINQVLDKERIYWILKLNKYHGNFKEFKESWKMVKSNTPANNVKHLALAAEKFFNGFATRTDKQWHPLFIAAQQGSLELCKLIVKKTGEYNPKRVQDGCTPLHMAAQEGNVEVYKLLASNLENKNIGDNIGCTPLHLAAQNGHLKVCGLIMETLVDKNPGINGGSHSKKITLYPFEFWQTFDHLVCF